MPTPEDPLETVEHNLNKVYSDITREVAVSKSFTEEAVRRLVSQKITLDEHTQIFSDHTTRLDRIETMLTQILTHLKKMPSSLHHEQELSDPDLVQPEPVRQRHERTFWERMLRLFSTEPEKP